MRYDYYLHRTGGFAFDYWGGIGRPYIVNVLWWYFMRLIGYKATRVQANAPLRRVYIRASLFSGAHRHSHTMDKMRDGIWDEV